MTQKGYILIADITGYTAYLSQTELTHSQEILESLMNTLVEHIHPPIIISRIEGDGVFAYTLEDCFLQGKTLLEIIEHLYSAFANDLEHMKRNTTCTCQACRLMPDLDLKIISHYGEFGLQTVGDRTDLVGTDVNLTHRLGKNSITEKTGVEAYAFISEACIEAMRLKSFADKKMIPHAESYEHIGEVQGYVYDLHPIWERERQRRRVIVSPEEADLDTNFTLPVSPAMAWDFLNDPMVRAQYFNADNMGTTKIDGRMMVGSQFHCAHGDVVFDQVILDWQPFDYLTYDHAFTIKGSLKACMRFTFQLEEQSDGTNVRMLVTKPVSSNPIAKAITMLAWKSIKEGLTQSRDHSHQMLLEAIEAKANPEIPKIKIPVPAQ